MYRRKEIRMYIFVKGDSLQVLVNSIINVETIK